ncbi:MAG TPA: hypothetical protein VHQ95_18630, partial [Pyrinomonadaceae bacterium]|nr:hypothetical protein [Pyrinomonadaceae bacterium]
SLPARHRPSASTQIYPLRKTLDVGAKKAISRLYTDKKQANCGASDTAYLSEVTVVKKLSLATIN